MSLAADSGGVGDGEVLGKTLATSRPTHSELVERAGRWLRNTRRCSLVLLEPGYGYPSEVPDAIGWRKGASVVVECKASRSDFLADANKPVRRRVLTDGDSERLGDERWFLMPWGMVEPDKAPPGWGVLLLKGERILRARQPVVTERSAHALRREVNLLASFGRASQLSRGGDTLYERARFGPRNLGISEDSE